MGHAETEATSRPAQNQNQTNTAPQEEHITDPQPQEPPEQPPNPRLTSLQNKHATLTSTLASLQATRASLVAQTPLPSGLAMPASWSEEEKASHALASANATVKEHIRLLHEYNEIKDVGQGLMGLVAEGRGVRVKSVMEDFGVGEKD